jgi:hypothetical protein
VSTTKPEIDPRVICALANDGAPKTINTAATTSQTDALCLDVIRMQFLMPRLQMFSSLILV